MDMHVFKSMLKLIAVLWIVLPAAALGQVFQEGPVDTDQAIAELVADVSAIRPGQTFDVALRIKLDPHWHAYWKNPGDAGLAPKIDWVLPDGFVAGELEFPVPERIATPPDFVSYGYEGEVFFLTQVTVPKDFAVGQIIALNAKASWLVCENMCIPGTADLALKLPVTETGESLASSPWADDLANAREELPRLMEAATLDFEVLETTVTASIDWDGFAGMGTDDLYFYVEAEGLVNSAAKQSFVLSDSSLIVSMEKSEWFEGEVDRLKGLLVSVAGFEAAGGVHSVALDSAAKPTGEASALAVGGNASVEMTFFLSLLFAFLGGVILNLMPCVFPVLSIKILGFVQLSGENPRKIQAHGVAFTAGVLLSFWALAGALIALRAGGESLGWGFQMQSPGFVGVLLLIMFVFGLNLAGVFEIGTSAIGLAGKVTGDGYGSSFFTGVFATAVATPCTGPFMGAAIGYALNLPVWGIMTVFTFLALGMAAPYLILSSFPKLIDRLPRPGPWMETFKQVMSFPMFATCIWLIWLMGAHVGNDGLILVLGGLLVVAIAAWVYGRWATPIKSVGTRRMAAFIALVIASSGVWMLIPSEETTSAVASEASGGPDKYGVTWEDFSPEFVAASRAEGKPVFIDFTAKWCLTCKANKAVVFASDEVKLRFEELGVVMVRGDWTKRNPVITEALESFGRSGVPLYILYDGNPTSSPQLLPELLNPGIVLEALDKIGSNSVASR
jgi:thiol:disulfide interchange protein DsbD